MPGYRRLDNPAHRAHIAGIWGVAEQDLPQPGRSAYEMLDDDGHGRGVRALLVFGSNPLVSAPRAGHIEKRLAALDFLVVADFFLSETAALADVVLPSAQWAEEDGTMTNLEGRVMLRQRAAAPPPGRAHRPRDHRRARPPGSDAARSFSGEPETVFEELRRASAGGVADYAGITYERICAGGRRVLAVPGTWIIRARRACSWTALPPTTAGRAFIPCSIAAPPRSRTTSTPSI